MKNIYTIILLLFISLFNNGFSQTQTVTFNYTGAPQTWTVPAGVTSISVTLKGGKGGGPLGGLGANITHPSIPVTPCQVLQINVGQAATAAAGGWNGGGNGYTATPALYSSFGGGGGSDIRTTPYALTNRLIVAAGGGGFAGGSSNYTASLTAGSAGCTAGTNGLGSVFTITGGMGGTQTAGGNGGPPWGGGGQAGGTGTLGTGGNGGVYLSAPGGGGGGGYYGGGGGGSDGCCPGANGGASGGGGSCFVPAGGTCTAAANSGNGLVTITYSATVNVITISNNGPFCVGDNIQLTATSGAVSYSWSGPNGFTSTLQNPLIPNCLAVNGGVYTLTYDLGGCLNTLTTNVVVNVPVNPTFNAIGPLCHNSLEPILSTSSLNVPAIQGTWNPATISTATVGTQTYTFTPNQGICANTATMNVTILPNAQATFNQIAPYCINDNPVALPATSTNAIPYTGTWSPSVISTNTADTISYVFTPTAGQCAFPFTMDIITHALTTPAFDPMGQICQFEANVLLPTTALNTTPFLNGPLIIGAWNSPTVITGLAGTANYTFTPNPGQCATTFTMPITVDPLIIPALTQVPQLCENDANPVLPLLTNNTPPVTGTWNPPLIDTSIPGIFTYTFTADVGQCSNPVNMNITIVPAVPPQFVADTLTGCNPLNVTLSTPPVLGATYTWYWGGTQIGQGSTFSYQFDQSGYHDITLEYDLLGCIESTTYNDYIFMESYPLASFSSVPSNLTETTQAIQFMNASVGGTTYTWDFDDSYTSTESDPNHMYVGVTENLLVTLTAYTPLGCSDEYTLSIPVIADPIYYVANTFTPDEDEHNQTWQAIFTTGFDPFAFSLTVYDRWGEIIWETHNAAESWDGTYGPLGTKVPAGIYSWRMQYEPKENDDRKVVTGHLNLIR
ncbi:MAG: hypothetical protein RL207_1986 [Bacteroidota bacterium]|jgi:gliding motility-associated-like protein